MSWEVVIGLEVHVQLATRSKIFSGSSTEFGSEPNTQASLVDLGYPGVLPVLNAEAVAMAVKFGVACDAVVNRRSLFARKNYFYPDLPKGYQISQFEIPIVGEGKLTIKLENGTEKVIGLTRAHLEEDAGKSMHEDFQGNSGIDLNRAGTPLLEIVTDPDMRSAQEATALLRKLHTLVRYLEISDGNMQEGSFRCDANISVRPTGQAEYGTRAEIKNLNSFRFIEKAIDFEVERQVELIEDGGKVVQETRLYDSDKNETRSMRGKEEANDYRYFPDPDLLPVVIDDDYIAAVRAGLPELPEEKTRRYSETMGLSDYDAQVLTADRAAAHYFEALTQELSGQEKLCANWVIGNVTAALNKSGYAIENCPVSSSALAELLRFIVDDTISGKIAKDVFELMWDGEGSAEQIISDKGLKQISDAGELEAIISSVIENNPNQLAQYRSGKDKLFGFFVGQVMKVSQGKANPAQVNALLKKLLAPD